MVYLKKKEKKELHFLLLEFFFQIGTHTVALRQYCTALPKLL